MIPFINHIQSAFQEHSLVPLAENTYIIKDSENLSRKVASKIICLAKYCPVFSDNRIEKNLYFTVVPFQKNESYNCKDNDMKEEDLWHSISSTSHQFESGKPIVIQGKTILKDSSIGQKEMFEQCTEISSLMIDFFHEAPTQGDVLDLGCGLGCNSFALLLKDWNVTAVDISSNLLKMYENTALKNNKKDQLTLVHGDITTQEFQKNKYDVVICIDTIPYINSKKVQPLMQKIHNSLKINGKLFGTLFVSPAKDDPRQELQEKLGAHFYEGQHIAFALLKHTGFNIDMCAFRLDNEYSPMAIEFIGTKK